MNLIRVYLLTVALVIGLTQMSYAGGGGGGGSGGGGNEGNHPKQAKVLGDNKGTMQKSSGEVKSGADRNRGGAEGNASVAMPGGDKN